MLITTCGTSPVGGGASRESREKALACRTVGARVAGWADTLLKERGNAGDVRGGRPLAPARTARATTCKVRKSRPRYLARHRSVCGKSEDALQPCSLARQETAPGREPLHDVVPCHSFLPHRILRLLVVTASQ